MRLALLSLVLAFPLFSNGPASHTATQERDEVEKPAYHWGESMTFQIFGSEEKSPFMRIFPGGKTKDKKEADVLPTLKFGRGASKLYPDDDAKPGLIVVFRTLAFTPDKTGKDYEAILEGEFNAVRVKVARKEMESLLAGKPTKLRLKSSTPKSVLTVTYTVKSDTEFQLRLEGKKLYIDGVSGNCTVTRTNSLTGAKDDYVSETITQEKNKGDLQLYIGKPGELAKLPILNK